MPAPGRPMSRMALIALALVLKAEGQEPETQTTTTTATPEAKPTLDCQFLADDYCRSKCGAQVGAATVVIPAVCDQDWALLSPAEVASAVSCECREVVLPPGGSPGGKPLNLTGGTVVFAAGMQGSKCYRIPTIIRTSRGTLLAFAEQRLSGCGDNGNNNLVLRRSANGGKTWSPIQLVVRGNGRALSNPNPVEVNMGGRKMAVLLHYDTENNPSHKSHGANMQIWSYDDGLTWGDAADITHYMPPGFAGCMPGPTVGVQSRDGTIYFTCHGFGANAFIYWSTSLGKKWQASAVISGVDECSLALLPNQSLLMNCRTGGPRAQMVWGSRGKPLTPLMYPWGLVDPSCQGSIIRVQDTIYLSNAASWDRSHLTVKRSTDYGATYDAGRVVWAGPSAYSQLVGWPESGGAGTSLGVLFEAGVKHPYDCIAFVSWSIPDPWPLADAFPGWLGSSDTSEGASSWVDGNYSTNYSGPLIIIVNSAGGPSVVFAFWLVGLRLALWAAAR